MNHDLNDPRDAARVERNVNPGSVTANVSRF